MKEKLLNNFLRISNIYRESGHEEKIADFFVNVAKKNNLYFYKDSNNNVLIKKSGNINSKPIAIQAHLDMVCIKNKNSNHNFEKEGIKVIVAGDKIKAKDTSLGADQGVGLALMLTLIEDKLVNHPDLEFLFTVEEETTFKGAITFPYDKVTSKRMINLDNSKDDIVTIGADGDICNEYYFKDKFIDNNLPSYRILIDNFPGGNSGENVALAEKNAITTMANILKDKDVYLKSINGGHSENDLAEYCEVVINTNLNPNDIFDQVPAKIRKIDNRVSFSRNSTKDILNEVLNLKCGFLTPNMSSANLGKIITTNNEIKIYYVIRSINDKELEKINNYSKKTTYHFKVSEIYNDSIWKINQESKLLEQYKSLYYEEYRENPKEAVDHGGVECSSIKKRIEGLDIISIGANIEKYHTINETTSLNSWVKIYTLLTKLLEII